MELVDTIIITTDLTTGLTTDLITDPIIDLTTDPIITTTTEDTTGDYLDVKNTVNHSFPFPTTTPPPLYRCLEGLDG